MKRIPMKLPRAQRGFTLVEVMVSLIVISVGLLGIVGMEGLALSSSANARMRSLAALEAAGLAATMHTNRDFWLANAASVTIQGSSACATVAAAASCIKTDSTGALTQAGADCTSAGDVPCSINELAAYDTQNWVASLSALLPSPIAKISCPNVNTPLQCAITIVWVENSVSLSAQQQAAAATAAATIAGGGAAPGFENNSYTLYVQP